MAGQFPRPIGSVAHVVALLVSGLSIGVPLDPASADDCLKAPNSAAPQGSHWYYRLDRANQRKCWYLRAPGQPAQQAAAPATSAAATPSNSTSARSGPMAAVESATAPTSITPGDSAPPSPHIKILAVTPKPAPVVGGTTDELVRQGPPKGNAAPAFPEVPAPQASTSSQTSAQAAGPVPAASAPWPDPRPAFATINAQEPVAVQTDAHADSVQPPARAHASDGEKGTPRGGEPANNAGLPVIIFPMLALGLVAAGALSRVGMNIVAARRARPIVHHPASDWDDDQRQHELRDHHEEYGSAELREYPSLTSAVRDYGPRIPFRADDEKANNARGHGEAGQILADDEWPDNARGHGQAGQIPAGDEWPDNARGHGDAGQIQADDERPGDACGHGDAGQIQADDERPGDACGHGDADQMQADDEWPDNAYIRGEAGQITEEVRKSEDTLALLDRLLRSPRAA